MKPTKIPRKHDRTLVFTGELIGFSSTREEGKPRWSEAFVYKTDTNKYVVGGVGRTTIAGEEDLWWAHVVDTARAAVDAMYRTNARGIPYLTIVAEDALRDAAEHDSAFMEPLSTEYV